MIKGVDLSTYQTNINYEELKRKGVEFAILRCGYGKNDYQKDDMFETHYEGCKRAGLKVGAYLFSYAYDEEGARLEAENTLKFINGKSFELPIFYDMELSKQANLGKNTLTRMANEWCNIIKNAGYKAGVYANLNWFINYLNPYEIKSNGNYIWLAQWNNEITADFNVDIWQNTNHNEFGFDGDYLINENLLVENVDNPVENIQEIQSLAVDVIFGLYGNGQERKDRLGNKYNDVQDVVNEIYKIVGG